jgi:hypothetical protein
MTAWYRAGTVEATNGQTTVTGTLTAWLANAKVGDLFAPDADGRGYEITAVTSNTEIEIFPAYAGSSGSGKEYGIARISPNWNSVSELSVSLADILETQQSILSGEGVPDNSIGQEGDVYFRQDEAEYYKKSAGEWELVTSLTGPQGPAGPSYQATSTSSVAIGTGAKTFTVESGRGYSAGQWLRASNDASNYMEGTVTSYSGTTLVLNVPTGRAVGSGTYTSWNINITGDIGPANSLTIGSVTTGAAGSSASAEITGSPPSQTLNLTIPRGNQGVQGIIGPAGTMAVGTVTTLDTGEPATVENVGTTTAAILNFGLPRGDQGIQGPTGPNTGLDYAWDTGTGDTDPGNGDIRVNNAAWGSATFAFVSKTGRNGEALESVIAALCGADNAHRAHLRVFPISNRAIYLEAEITSAIVDGGNYWKLPLSGVVASVAMPAAADVLSVSISRSGEAAASGADVAVHALLGGL